MRSLWGLIELAATNWFQRRQRIGSSHSIELCGWLRKFDSDTPILFFSGAAYEQDKRAALAAGAQGYLTKPADNDKLIDEVSRLISDARRSRAAVNLAHVAASGHFGM